MSAPGTSGTARPEVSVVVCTINRSAALRRCLASLEDLDHPSFEVVVVDNSAGDEQAEAAAAEVGARYVHQPRPGLSEARNAGGLAARGELVAFIDDDATADRSWLRRHEDAHSESGAAATTGRILPPAGASSVGAHLLDRGDQPLRVTSQTPDWFAIANFGGLGFGGNMVLDRELFERGFRFRASLGSGAQITIAEEFYAFFTILREGEAIEYVPEAIVYHEAPPTEHDIVRRELDGARQFSAYLCLLFVEERAHRAAVGAHLMRSLRRRRPPWSSTTNQKSASRMRLWLAAAGGPRLYLRHRRDERRAAPKKR
jgi:O-antigen biosynthesis protein